ncbi:hypothetical protein GobsT_63410 [Gemmata obscuriglobus]|nr:hypothetical protein [Gemmata obscuriglobus]QEG31519.1 hypothetical protein GobsT_63410 [Gemmata obscuriglobus]VTS10861.1 unnamed protein product [Gemmata obscuriglobus UQM 2246]
MVTLLLTVAVLIPAAWHLCAASALFTARHTGVAGVFCPVLQGSLRCAT